MKFAVAFLATLFLVSCSGDSTQILPTAPGVSPGTTTPLAFVWAMVVDESGVCVVGATVQIVRGQSVGQEIKQITPCDAWSYDGGAVFKDLTPGVEITLRASASGYTAQEKTLIPSSGPQQAVLFTPARIG